MLCDDKRSLFRSYSVYTQKQTYLESSITLFSCLGFCFDSPTTHVVYRIKVHEPLLPRPWYLPEEFLPL